MCADYDSGCKTVCLGLRAYFTIGVIGVIYEA